MSKTKSTRSKLSVLRNMEWRHQVSPPCSCQVTRHLLQAREKIEAYASAGQDHQGQREEKWT